MQRYILRRVFQSVLTLLVLSVLIFIVCRLTGDPVLLMLPDDASPEDVAQLRVALGLEKPLPVQYWLFLSSALRGNFGRSIKGQVPVMYLIEERLPNSLKLALVSLLITVVLAFPLGVAAAVKKGTSIDTVANLLAVLGQSLPQFWVGMVLIQIFAVHLRWLPVAGTGSVWHYILPGFTLGWFLVAGIMRLLRSSMLDVLDSEYVKLARIKGVSGWSVVWKHALKNAVMPVLTFAAIYVAILITGAILVETVFAWPGIGQLIYQGIVYRDFPVIQAVVLLTAVIVVTVNLIVDISYAYLDPRIRLH
ncbi:MAG TPA: ABC transporter permease [Candidatus Tectomicrobia bacterium]|nr:ABC transporter permease [Candidatus Tectomicrobia bacterium]